jgi:hypothetical protein
VISNSFCARDLNSYIVLLIEFVCPVNLEAKQAMPNVSINDIVLKLVIP